MFYTQKGEKLVHFARKDAINAYPMILDFMNSEFERVEKAENTIKSIRVFRSTKALLYISKNIIDAYNNYKEIYSVLDYEDLVVKTRTLLENKENADWVLFKLDGGIDHILIKGREMLTINTFKRYSPEYYLPLSDHSPVFIDAEI